MPIIILPNKNFKTRNSFSHILNSHSLNTTLGMGEVVITQNLTDFKYFLNFFS